MQIYLDIDGVMVPANSWKRPCILEDGFMDFSPKAVRALNSIISNFNTEIILTTSHKHIYSLPQWMDIFINRNVIPTKISRLPENKNNLTRKNELLQWFNINGITDDFIIIDDDKTLNELPSFIKSKLIQTSGTVGLVDYLVQDFVNNIVDKSITSI